MQKNYTNNLFFLIKHTSLKICGMSLFFISFCLASSAEKEPISTTYTQKTIINIDGFKTVKVFNQHHRKKYETRFDIQGNMRQETQFNPDNSHMTIRYNPNGSKKVAYFNTHSKLTSQFEINPLGDVTSKLTMSDDGLMTINLFNSNQQIHTQYIKDTQGNTIQKITFNEDQSKTITRYKPSGAKEIINVDTQYQPINASMMYTDGTESTINYDGTTVAWHESGHIIGSLCHYTASNIDSASIEYEETSNSHGRVLYSSNYLVKTDLNILQKIIIKKLSGACAEQILKSEGMIIDPEKITQFFSCSNYCHDLAYAEETAQIILWNTQRHIDYQTEKHKEKEAINDIIAQLYPIAYQTLCNNKASLQKVAHLLLEKKSLSGDDIYDALHADKPLQHDEHGPLPKTYESDYAYRGWNT